MILFVFILSQETSKGTNTKMDLHLLISFVLKSSSKISLVYIVDSLPISRA